MFNSGVLDIVIGLVFIYLLYSLLATIIQELIASSFSFRAKILERAIFRMLEDENKFQSKMRGIVYLFRKSGNGADPNTPTFEFYKHPLIKYLGENKNKSKPSYLNKEDFSKVLIDLLRGNIFEPGKDIKPLIESALETKRINWKLDKIGDDTIKFLKSTFDSSKGDFEKFKNSIQYLFDEPKGTEPSSKIVFDLLKGSLVKTGEDIKPLIQKAIDEKKINLALAKISDETLSYLRSVWVDAQGEIEKFKESLESWFDATMERATGWYKKKTQIILLFIGFFIAVFFNVDTIEIANKLEKDPKLREQLVQQADVFVKTHPDLDKELALKKEQFNKFLAANRGQDVKQADDSINIKAIILSQDTAKYAKLCKTRDSLISQADSLVRTDLRKASNLLGIGFKSFIDKCKKENVCSFGLYKIILLSLAGWLITALALSLGAPFWFDLLNKLMKLRNSGAVVTPDQKQQVQDSKSPKIKRVG